MISLNSHYGLNRLKPALPGERHEVDLDYLRPTVEDVPKRLDIRAEGDFEHILSDSR